MSDYIIGLTGGIGSGKTTVANIFATLNIDIIDADIIAREVVEPGTDALLKIQNHFGTHVLHHNGSLNRAALRQIIFNDKSQKDWLEALLHPVIRTEIRTQLKKASNTYSYAILSSPLLLETDQSELVSQVIIIDIDRESQLERASKRDNNTKAQIERIIDSQIDRESRRKQADYIIDNCGSLKQLYLNIDALHKKLSDKYSLTSTT